MLMSRQSNLPTVPKDDHVGTCDAHRCILLNQNLGDEPFVCRERLQQRVQRPEATVTRHWL